MMSKFLTMIAILGQSVLISNAIASGPCDAPKPIFGKIVAICGNQMITYVGDQKTKILGVDVTKSEFELAYCESGGGRKPLNFETNSEGYRLISEVYERGKHQEKYQISRMWGDFELDGTDFYGKPVTVKCVDYKDTRTDIEYIHK